MFLVAVSTGHFEALIEECDRLRGQFDFFGQVGSTVYKPSFPHVQTLSLHALEQKVAEAELVVCHAGTGLLSMVYRQRKPTVVVPKQVRYGEANDGQVELAKKWAALGLGTLCLDVAELGPSIQTARATGLSTVQIPELGVHFRTLLS